MVAGGSYLQYSDIRDEASDIYAIIELNLCFGLIVSKDCLRVEPVMLSPSLFSVALLFAAVLSPISVIGGPPGFSSKVAVKLNTGNARASTLTKSKAAQKSNKVNDVTGHLQKTVNRIINGLKSIPKNFLEAERLKKIRKSGGNSALTFSEYGFIEKANEDMSKIFRMVITIPFSPEFFFYSYIVFPAMASNNPFAWSSMSSGMICFGLQLPHLLIEGFQYSVCEEEKSRIHSEF